MPDTQSCLAYFRKMFYQGAQVLKTNFQIHRQAQMTIKGIVGSDKLTNSQTTNYVPIKKKNKKSSRNNLYNPKGKTNICTYVCIMYILYVHTKYWCAFIYTSQTSKCVHMFIIYPSTYRRLRQKWPLQELYFKLYSSFSHSAAVD